MAEKDNLRRFLFEELAIRGEWVNLTQSWQQAKQHHQYPLVASQQLGQAMVATVLLTAIMKFKGSMILQIQGDGDIRTLVAQCTDERHIRGLVRCQDELTAGSLSHLFGQGHLVLTIQTEKAEPYQGVVGLDGHNIAEALEGYFTQSEQLKTRLWLFANETEAVGLFLQELPSKAEEGSQQEDWQRIEALANTVTETELMQLSCEDMLYRLFNEEKVRVFDAESVVFKCGCSNEKIENTLYSLGRKELTHILEEQDEIKVDCEYCDQDYRYDRIDVEKLLNKNTDSPISTTRH